MRYTVVIPCYNAERFLGEALASALGQTLPPEEILVVDDGSTDGSRELAAAHGERVRVLRQEHGGPGRARNRGVAEARTEWIAYLDADDVWLPGKIRRQADVIALQPDCALVYTGFVQFTPDGREESRPAPSEAEVRAALPFRNPIWPSTVMARRQLLSEEPWSERLKSSEDWELFYRLSRRVRFAAVEEPLMRYRLHPASLTHRDWRSVLLEARAVSDLIAPDFQGWSGIRRRRQVEARLLASAAIAARNEGSPEAIPLMLRSLAAWPLPGPVGRRPEALALMVARALRRR